MKTWSYRGVTIERVPHSGMYVALIVNHGYVRADTLAGVKRLISAALR